MKVKELRNLLENVPDETHILIRGAYSQGNITKIYTQITENNTKRGKPTLILVSDIMSESE